MKEVLAARRACPRRAHATFGAGDEDAALAYLETLPGLYVVKTDGLAAGKGVRGHRVDRRGTRARCARTSSGDAFGDAGPHRA